MRHQPSKIVLIASGIAISILLSTIAEGLMSMNTLGAYTVFKLFPPSMGPYDLRAVLFSAFRHGLCFLFWSTFRDISTVYQESEEEMIRAKRLPLHWRF